MESPVKATRAGGCLLAISIMVGTCWGLYVHQGSIGFLAGLGAGIAIAILLWLVDRVRR